MYIYISKYRCIHTHIYICACIFLRVEIWKYRCELARKNQLIHKHIHLTFYQSRHWMIGRHVDIIPVRQYLWICNWIYVPTCRHKCNWFTLKHLVLVRIEGLQKSTKIPENKFSNALLKSRFQNFAAFFLPGVTETNDAHLEFALSATLPQSCPMQGRLVRAKLISPLRSSLSLCFLLSICSLPLKERNALFWPWQSSLSIPSRLLPIPSWRVTPAHHPPSFLLSVTPLLPFPFPFLLLCAWSRHSLHWHLCRWCSNSNTTAAATPLSSFTAAPPSTFCQHLSSHTWFPTLPEMLPLWSVHLLTGLLLILEPDQGLVEFRGCRSMAWLVMHFFGPHPIHCSSNILFMLTTAPFWPFDASCASCIMM